MFNETAYMGEDAPLPVYEKPRPPKFKPRNWRKRRPLPPMMPKGLGGLGECGCITNGGAKEMQITVESEVILSKPLLFLLLGLGVLAVLK